MATFSSERALLSQRLESLRSYDDHLIVCRQEQRFYGLARANTRTTRVQRTRYGVYNRQIKEYPRGAYTLRGSHQSSQELLAWCRRATGSTQVESRTTHVERELRGLHQSIHGLLQEANGYIGPLTEHTYRSNLFELNLALFSLNLV